MILKHLLNQRHWVKQNSGVATMLRKELHRQHRVLWAYNADNRVLLHFFIYWEIIQQPAKISCQNFFHPEVHSETNETGFRGRFEGLTMLLTQRTFETKLSRAIGVTGFAHRKSLRGFEKQTGYWKKPERALRGRTILPMLRTFETNFPEQLAWLDVDTENREGGFEVWKTIWSLKLAWDSGWEGAEGNKGVMEESGSSRSWLKLPIVN